MNVLVCFKVTPNLDLLSATDFVADASGAVETGFVPNIINCYDESALELARALQASSAAPIHRTALTVGDDTADAVMKTLYALHYDAGVRIAPPGDLRFAPEQVAALVHAYLITQPQDIILAGAQSPAGDNVQMPLLLAEQLGYPCITQVTDVRMVSPDAIEVESLTDDGTLTQRVRPPVMLVVGDARSTFLKVPTLKDRMQRGRTPVQMLTMDAVLANTAPAATLCALQPLSRARAGEVLDTGSAAEQAARIYARYLQEIGGTP